ncbi:MAG: LptF/LptG family permease [Kiritimatiellia bacterium]
MKTIERYIVGSFLTAFFLCWLVLTFVLSIGLLVKVTSLIAKGMPVVIVGRYFLAGIPETLGFTIPLAVLIGSLLVFGRLSTDSEIAAMRACGINLLRVMLWPLGVALALSLICLHIHNEIAPRGEETRIQVALEAASNLGLDLMEPGVFNEGPNHMKFWFASRAGEWLTDLRMYDKTPSGLDREIRAARAQVSRKGNNLRLDLYDATIDPLDDEHPGAAQAARFSHEIADAFQTARRPKKIRTSGSGELRRMLPDANALQADPAQAGALLRACPDCARLTTKGKPDCRNPIHESARVLQNATGLYDPALVSRLKSTCQACRTRSCTDASHARIMLAASAYQRSQSYPAEIRVELNKRMALASAAFCFALIGMPLGIRSHRRESTVGVAIGLGIALLYYMAMILADALKESPGWHPELLAWLPAALCVVVAAILIPRNQ